VIENAKREWLRDPNAFVGYVSAITRNKFMGRLKKRMNQRENHELVWEAVYLEARSQSGQEPDGDSLWHAVADLPEGERELVLGIYREGYAYKEMSTSSGVPLGTLKDRLRPALQKLRAARRKSRWPLIQNRSLRRPVGWDPGMSCSHEIDIVEFLANQRGEDFREFREHYPGCAECSNELHAWSEVERLLREAGDAHPQPAELSRFELEPCSIDACRRAQLDAHLLECVSCRDETAALRRFVAGLVPARAAGDREGSLARASAACSVESRDCLWSYHAALRSHALVLLGPGSGC